nr:hypothetical protein [uncultured Roseococcus sp.]
MPGSSDEPPRRPRHRRFRLLSFLLLAVAALLVLDATGNLPASIQRVCAAAHLCGHDLLPGPARVTRLEFPVTENPSSRQPTHARILAQRSGDDWIMTLQIDALRGAARYSLIQVIATREPPLAGARTVLTLHDQNRQPVLNGRWEVTVSVPNEVFRNPEWVLHYRADTIDALAVSEDIAPYIRRRGAIR